jgi:AraC family transcriptional regulator, transcriptional activator of pobA
MTNAEVYTTPYLLLPTICRYHPERVKPHNCHHYVFIFQEEGNCSVMTDYEHIYMNGASILYYISGHAYNFSFSENVRGWMLTIDSMMIDERIRRLLEENFLGARSVNVPAEQVENLRDCVRLLHRLLVNKAVSDNEDPSIYMASTFISLVTNLYKEQRNNAAYTNKRSIEITRKFCSLVRKNFRTWKSPSYYASAMHLSLNYLNECVKQLTGMSASQWIQREIVTEAKRMLLTSELSIKEISKQLGFEDVAYFSRVFVKGVGTSPREFRKSG